MKGEFSGILLLFSCALAFLGLELSLTEPNVRAMLCCAKLKMMNTALFHLLLPFSSTLVDNYLSLIVHFLFFSVCVSGWTHASSAGLCGQDRKKDLCKTPRSLYL